MTPEEINAITEKIIGCAYKVYNTLGGGFLEKVYENALVYELRKAGLHAEQQKGIQVIYEEIVAGNFDTDIEVEREVLVELKAIKGLDDGHLGQCLNYLKATRKKICLLINFGPKKVEVRRIVNGLE